MPRFTHIIIGMLEALCGYLLSNESVKRILNRWLLSFHYFNQPLFFAYWGLLLVNAHKDTLIKVLAT